jgi:hypothetical protein
VTLVTGDQCMYGQMTTDAQGFTGPAMKPTMWMSNAAYLLDALKTRCSRRGGVCDSGNGHHMHLFNGRVKMAAIYPVKLCRAILKGMRDQIGHDVNNDRGQTVIHVLDSICPNEAELGTTNEAINPNPYQHADETNNDNTGMKDQDKYWDEITGKELDPNLVKKARKLELD